jgi:hypothetical protein
MTRGVFIFFGLFYSRHVPTPMSYCKTIAVDAFFMFHVAKHNRKQSAQGKVADFYNLFLKEDFFMDIPSFTVAGNLFIWFERNKL